MLALVLCVIADDAVEGLPFPQGEIYVSNKHSAHVVVQIEWFIVSILAHRWYEESRGQAWTV